MKKGSNSPPPIGVVKPSPSPIPSPKKIETINFCAIYDPDDDSPEIRNLIEDQKPGWQKELVKAVAQFLIDKMKEIDKEECEPYSGEDYFPLYKCSGREDSDGSFVVKFKKR